MNKSTSDSAAPLPQQLREIERKMRQTILAEVSFEELLTALRSAADALERAERQLSEANAADWAIRQMFDLAKDGDLFDLLVEWEQDRVAGEVRLHNAAHNVLAEPVYENGRKADGIAVHFLMRLSMPANEAGLEGWSRANPSVAEAIDVLGDPGQANIRKEVGTVRDELYASRVGAPQTREEP